MIKMLQPDAEAFGQGEAGIMVSDFGVDSQVQPPPLGA